MKSIELFAGIGGISLAAEWAGIETVAFCEREPFCQKILKKHWPNVPIFEDVRTLNKQTLQDRGIDVGTVDVISGGFPCQPYSIAGKRKGTEDDRDLWPEMFRIIEEIKPRWVVGENVANFARMELDRTLSDLESIGYETQAFIIPACAVGAIHRRDRTFIVANADSKLRSSSKIQAIDNPKSKREKFEEWKQFFFINRGANNVEFRKEDESKLCRNDDGVPRELDASRLNALGNAVVPQQIYPIFKAIMDIEQGVIT
jgi:DNA (cytosine-5)-methyltransferase 1